jgi:hypothetical protein
MADSSCPTVRIKSPAGVTVINESDFDAAKHERADALPPPPPEPPPPPPPEAGPLDGLPKDWATLDYGTLRGYALAATGRAPENQAQAVQMISAALASAKK